MKYSGFYIFYSWDIAIRTDPIGKWISRGCWLVSIWNNGLGINLYVFLILEKRVLRTILFPRGSHAEEGASYLWAGKDSFSRHGLCKLGKKHCLHFKIVIVNQSTWLFLFLTMESEFHMFRDLLGAPVWGHIIHSGNICNANIHSLTSENFLGLAMDVCLADLHTV